MVDLEKKKNKLEFDNNNKNHKIRASIPSESHAYTQYITR